MNSALVTYRFEDYLRETNAAQSLDELFQIYLKTVKKHGLDRAIFSLITDHASTGDSANFGMIHNYPESWLKHYVEQEYKYIDPVMLFAACEIHSFKWDDIPQGIIVNKKQKLCLNLGKEAGLHNGVCSPFRGVNNELAGIALATSESKDAFDGNVELINAYSNHFYHLYRKMRDERPLVQELYLTKREREVLKWVATGKTNDEISEIICISEDTVDYHLRKIYRKLNANSRVLAAVKGISMGLVHL